MKRLSKGIMILLVCVLILQSGLTVEAKNNKNNNGKKKGYYSFEVEEEKVTEDDFETEEEEEEEDDIEESIEATEEEDDDDDDDDKTSEKSKGKSKGNNGLGGLSKEEKKEFLQDKKMLREMIKAAYSEEELEAVAEVAEELSEKYDNLNILPVDSIISNRFNFKFDVPPVIKEGRTLIPVRAITEGLGAEVTWDDITKTVIIKNGCTTAAAINVSDNGTTTSGSMTIMMKLGENEVTVNGDAVEIDTEASIYNSRMFVPLRFIAETFGLDVNWDGDTETIEINEVE